MYRAARKANKYEEVKRNVSADTPLICHHARQITELKYRRFRHLAGFACVARNFN